MPTGVDATFRDLPEGRRTSLNIENDETCRLAGELARLTGETMTGALAVARRRLGLTPDGPASEAGRARSFAPPAFRLLRGSVVPDGLFTPALLLAAAVAAAGGALRGFTGTGNSMLMTPLYALIFGPVPTVALIVLFDVAVALPLMRHAFRLTRWRIVLPLAAASWITMPAGTWLLIHLDPEIMKKVMAAAVLAFALVLLTGWRYRGRVGTPATLAVGAVTGVSVGATAMGGPIYNLYILNTPGDRHAHRAAFNSLISLTAAAVLALLVLNGAVAALTLWQAAVIFPVFASFIWVGSRLFRRANEAVFRRTVLIVLAVMGVAILFA